MRYFKKQSGGGANLDLQLPNGQRLTFKSVDGGTWGYQAVVDQNLINTFEQMMREQSGGLTEITAEEFVRDYAEPKKKGQVSPPKQFSREELSHRGVIGQLASDRPAVRVAAASAAPAADPLAPVVTAAPVVPPTEVRPRVGKRGKM